MVHKKRNNTITRMLGELGTKKKVLNQKKGFEEQKNYKMETITGTFIITKSQTGTIKTRSFIHALRT